MPFKAAVLFSRIQSRGGGDFFDDICRLITRPVRRKYTYICIMCVYIIYTSAARFIIFAIAQTRARIRARASGYKSPRAECFYLFFFAAKNAPRVA